MLALLLVPYMLLDPIGLLVMVLTPLLRDLVDAPDREDPPPTLTAEENWFEPALLSAYTFHSLGNVAIL